MSSLARYVGIVFCCCLTAGAQAQDARTGTARPPATPNPEKMDVLKQLSASFEEVSQRSGRAVVQIFVRSYVPNEGSAANSGELLTAEDSSGSGIVMSQDGYILTNAHVVKGAHSVRVQLSAKAVSEVRQGGDPGGSRPLPGSVVGIDRDTDLAVIKVEKKNLPYLTLGDSDELKQGQIVLALGNPLGLDNSVSMGVVSAVARQIRPDDNVAYIQTDTPINPGNSGGPLLDTDGRVVGINTLILTQSGGNEGIGFAIPSNLARDVYSQLKSQGHVHRSQLGIVGATITPELAEGLDLQAERGIIVSDVEPNGPAAHAGIKVDDIVVGLGTRPISTFHQLESRVFRSVPGTKLSLLVQRGEQTLTVPIITEEKSGDELDALADLVDPVKNVVPQLGIVGLDITKPVLELMPDLRRPAGVVVAARKAGSAYAGASLETGDAIYAVNRSVVSNVAQLRQYLASLQAGKPIVLQVERAGHLLYLPMQLE